MRRPPTSALPAPASGERHDWQTLKSLLPFIWTYKGRVLFALGLIALLGGVALVIEGGNAYQNQRSVQNGADAASENPTILAHSAAQGKKPLREALPFL